MNGAVGGGLESDVDVHGGAGRRGEEGAVEMLRGGAGDRVAVISGGGTVLE